MYTGGIVLMIEELKQKAIKASDKKCANGCSKYYRYGFQDGYIIGAIENGLKIHDLRQDPNDLPECNENKQITFYVEEWIESVQKYHKHYCLGFYKNAFLLDDVKLFVEKSKGYENEHLPKTVLFWYENPIV